MTSQFSLVRVDCQTYNCHTNPCNPRFVIDSHFEKYYTHCIEVNALMRLFHIMSQVGS